MAYTIRITQEAEASSPSGSSPPYPSEISLADLTAAILVSSEGSDLESAVLAILAGLPTADPLVDGAFWLNSGVVTISAGAE